MVRMKIGDTSQRSEKECTVTGFAGTVLVELAMWQSILSGIVTESFIFGAEARQPVVGGQPKTALFIFK